jgi:hypothetical protein
MFAASDRLAKAFDEMKENLEHEGEAPIEAPDDIEAKVKAKLREKRGITWHRAVRLIVDPEAPEDEDDEAVADGDSDDDEDDDLDHGGD